MLCRPVLFQLRRAFPDNFMYLEVVAKRLKTTQPGVRIGYINEQMQYLNSIIRSSELPGDWSEVKSKLLSKRGEMTSKNINAVIIKSFISANSHDPALSFVSYIKHTENDLSLGTVNGILRLYYTLGRENKLSQDQIDFIRSMCKSLYDKYKLLDGTTSEALVHALAVIGDWKNCMKILEDIKVASCPSHSAYSVVISALFKCNEKRKAIELIGKSLQDNRPLLDHVYEDWIDYIIRSNKGDVITKCKEMEEMNIYIATNFIRVSERVANSIYNAYVSMLNWSGSRTEVSMSGKCHACKEKLNHIPLSPEEFTLLQSSFKDRVLIGKDVFLKTSPEELDRFVKFIEKTAPYDVVLDALNIAYAIGNSSPLEKLKFLRAMVQHFLDKNKKVLVLGRDHILKWPKRELNFIMQNTHSFFTNDLSQDDPFFLTATIFSGPKTDFLSRDKMRGHRFLLRDEKLRSIFLRWQWEHQLTYSIKRRNIPFVMPQLQWTPCAQRSECAGWHVPYELGTRKAYEDPMNADSPVPARWLCLRPPLHE